MVGVDGGGEAGSDLLLGLGEFAAMMEVSGAGVGGGALAHDEGGGSFEGFLESKDFVGVFFEVGGLKEEVAEGAGVGESFDVGLWGGGEAELSERDGVVAREGEGDGEGGIGGDGFAEVEDGEVRDAGVVAGFPAGLDVAIV